MLPLQKAQEVVRRAVEAAAAQNVNIVAVAVDLSGHPVAVARMDATSYINTDVAQRKAVLSAAFGAPTHAVQAMIGKDPIANPVLTSDPRIAMLPGGMPIVSDGKCVGGVGVAGGHYLQDQAVAEYATGQ